MLDEHIMAEIHDAAAKGLDTLAPDKPKCTWTDDEGGCWDTSCGHRFVVNDGTPSENSMAYCCFCGKEIEEVLPEPEGDEE